VRETAVHAFLVFMFYICYVMLCYIYIYAVFILRNIPYLHAASLHICTYPGARVAPYRSGLQAGWPGFDFWHGQDILLFPTDRLLRPAQPPIQWVNWLVLSYLHLWLRSRMVELYLHSSICLQVMVLNYFSAGKCYLLPFTSTCTTL
jgi:hypothetical protein